MSDPVDFKALFDLLPNPYMLLDRELRYVTANQAYLRVTSARLEDLIGRHILDAFPHDPLDPQNSNARQLRESLQRVIDTRQPDAIALIPYRVPRQTARGLVLEERSWSATHTPILENGEVAFVLQHTVDVTDLEQLKKAAAGTLVANAPSVMVEQDEAGLLGRARRVEETNLLIEAERSHLRRLFQQAPGFMAFLRGSEHVFELTNAAYDQLVGHRDVLGKRVRDALPEVKGQGFVEALDRVYQAGEPFLGRGVRAVLQRTRGRFRAPGVRAPAAASVDAS